jgi:predicted phosphoribosyltransferase
MGWGTQGTEECEKLTKSCDKISCVYFATSFSSFYHFSDDLESV